MNRAIVIGVGPEQGLGAQLCLRFAAEGLHVIAAGRTGAHLEAVTEAIRNSLLIIPGNVFSSKDTHFRISYAAEDATLERGVEVLKKIARQGRPSA